MKAALTKIILLNLSLFVLGQKDYAYYKKKYPNQQEVYTSLKKEYNFNLEKERIKATMEEESKIMVLTNNNKVAVKDYVFSSSFAELAKLEAYTISNQNKQIKVKEYHDKKDFDSGISFHDDAKKTEFVYPNIQEGSTKVKHVLLNFKDPHLLRSTFLADDIPIEEFQLTVTAHKDIDIGYKLFNQTDNLEFSKKEKGKNNIYTWKINNVKDLKYESNALGSLHVIPHIEIFIKSYKNKKGKTINVLSNLDDLHKLYKSFLKRIKKYDNQKLKTITDEIIKDSNSDEEKIIAIYKWVQKNIKYIAFEDGYGGFIPRSAGSVLDNRYGDCKDMSNIIVEMAKLAGVQNVNLAWIGTRKRPYSYYELHTPLVDDHMIAVYKKDNQFIFLDGTSENIAYGYPSEFIQGKEALINIKETGGYEVVKVPEVKAENNMINEIVQIKINESNKITGKGTSSFSGYYRTNIMAHLTDNNAEKRKEAIKSLVNKGSNKFILDSYKEEDSENQFIINYDFQIGNYVTNLENEKYINLILNKPLNGSSIKSNRIHDYDMHFKTENNFQYNLNIPKEYKFEYIPENDSFTNELGEFKIEYDVIDSQNIQLNFHLKINTLSIKKEQFKQWNMLVKKIKSNYNESIGIIKN